MLEAGSLVRAIRVSRWMVLKEGPHIRGLTVSLASPILNGL